MKPFLKWVGGKYKIIDTIKSHLPPGGRLIEPFVGSGSVFLNTEYSEYLLADANKDIINTYKCIQNNNGFIEFAASLFCKENNNRTQYERLRSQFNTTQDLNLKSAIFIYLNRHGFNGLCRYNSTGDFNTSFGYYTEPKFPLNEIFNFKQKSKNSTFKCQDFEITMLEARRGDVVYCDPPYMSSEVAKSFTGYTSSGFCPEQHIKLAELATLLAKNQITVIISNHNTKITRELYANASSVTSFEVQRYVAANAKNRINVTELLAVFD